MKTLADRLKNGLELLGYEYNQLNQFSVEITNKAIVVNEKIDLSSLTKNKDNLNILFFLREPRVGGPMKVDKLSVTVNRHPVSNFYRNSLPSTLMKKEYHSDNIPTKDQLFNFISKQLNISINQMIELINKREQQFLQHKKMYRPFIK